MQSITTPQIIYLIIAAATLALLITDRLRVDLVGLLVILALALTGILTPQQAFSGLGSEPALVIAAIFVLSRGLQLTGVADTVTGWIVRLAGKSERRMVSVMMLGVSAFSTFTEHVTPTAIMMPVLLRLSRERNIPASKLLMPLSFAASLGSTIALIGAPAFLFASTLLQRAGRPALGLFSIAPIGLVLVVIGVLYVLLIGRFLLPSNKGRDTTNDIFTQGRYLAEVSIPPESTLIGAGHGRFHELGLRSLEILKWMRDGKALRGPLDDFKLNANDMLLVRLTPDDLATLRQEPEGVRLKPIEQFDLPGAEAQTPGEELSARLAQAVVMPGSSLIGHTIHEANLQHRYGIVVVALSRQGAPTSEAIDRVRLRAGDVLVLEGDEDEVRHLTEEQPTLLMAPFPGKPRPRTAKRAAAIMLGVIAAASFNIAPLEVVAVAGAVAMVLVGCLTVNQAYDAIDKRIFLFIAGAIPLGTAMQKTGLAAEAGRLLQTWLGHWPEFWILVAIFAVAGLLTQVLSDTATLSILGPVAIAFAHALGRAPEPFVLAVAFASVTSFLTPIAHWGNLLVFTPGQYRFTDFVKVGTPLTVLIALVVAWMGPIVFG
ncbi:SLC13 family permease [Noviherbaspirillum massiliense]|uniref:SLC13 family permease n=1 Tax=Noviherbaspirillum massiliense TaxID=1465823 RepID=UPI0003134533|nr:SLC13 family permease [Noviherbaspirillum massiliense]